MKSVRHLLLAPGLALVLLPMAAFAGSIDVTQGYDVFVHGNATFDATHVHGSTATGGNVSLTGNMSEFANDGPTNPGLTVAGQVNQGADARINGNGILNVGSLSGGQSVNSSDDLVGSGHTLYANAVNVGPVGVDFGTAFTQLTQLSDTFASTAGTVSLGSLVSGGNLSYTFGSSDTVDFLDITGDQLAAISNLGFSGTPTAGSSLVVNVDLSGYTGGAFAQNRNGSNTQATHILWNFYGASSLSLQNQFIGTILAPTIDLTHTNNDIYGTVIADTFTNSGGEVHVDQYQGTVPKPVPDSASTALLVLVGLAGLVVVRRLWDPLRSAA